MADGFDFSELERMDVLPAGEGRLFLERDALTARTPVLLFVHGAYHGAWCWSAWLRRCRNEGRAAAAIDVRGHGGLPVTSRLKEAGVRDYAADVAAAMARFDTPPVLVGHSLGALVVALAAATAPASGLVLLTPSPPGQLEGAKALPPVDETALLPAFEEDVVREMFLPNHVGQPIDAMLKRLSPESPVAMNDRYLLRVPVERDAITCPAHCIEAGRDSPLTHPPGQDEAVARFYGASYAYLAEAAHCVMMDVDGGVDALRSIGTWYDEAVRPQG